MPDAAVQDSHRYVFRVSVHLRVVDQTLVRSGFQILESLLHFGSQPGVRAGQDTQRYQVARVTMAATYGRSFIHSSSLPCRRQDAPSQFR